jgi:excinuclease ABC subunit C
VLTQRLEFDPESENFDQIPPSPAVFLLRGADLESQPYVSKTANLRRLLQRLLGIPTGQTKRLNLRALVRSIEYSTTGSDFESGFLLYRLLREIFPRSYAARLRLRFAPLIKLHLDNDYPRASITRRIGRLSSPCLYYGPFGTRIGAEKFASDSLDFFKMRRCIEDLHPDPAFPGCIYSEMKMCLAPCFKGCADDQYQHEAQRVQSYFESRGHSLLREFSVQRDEASMNTDFEGAAAVHLRIEKLHSLLLQLPEIVHRIDRLNGLILQPSAAPGCINLFQIRGALICGPLSFAIQSGNQSKSQSMEARIQESLSLIPKPDANSALEISEHLALLRRWFYRSRRVGEIYFADAKGTLPMRRIVRGVSRVMSGERLDPELPQLGATAENHPMA